MGCQSSKSQQKKLSQDLNILAYSSKIEGQFDVALKLYNDILNDLNSSEHKKKDNLKIAQTHSHIADIYLKQKNFILALQNLSLSLDLFSSIYGTQSKVIQIIKIKIAKCQLHLKLRQQSYQNLYESLSQNIKLPEKTIIEALALLSLISDEELKNGNFDNAINIKLKAFTLSSQYFGETDIVSIEIQNQLNQQLQKRDLIDKFVDNKVKQDLTSSVKECAICFDDIKMDCDIQNCQITICKHQFHTQCLYKWLLKDMSCPVCRRKLVD